MEPERPAEAPEGLQETAEAEQAPEASPTPRPRLRLATAPLLVRAEEAAALLGVSERTLWRLIARGQAPEPVRLGRRRLWDPLGLAAWVARGCRPPASPGRREGRGG